MKVAILHDWLTGFRGGERVLEAFCEMFPTAKIYTLIYQQGSASPGIESHSIQTSFLNSVPGIYSQYRKFLPLFPLAVESMKIEDEPDLVLSSSHCVIKGLKKPSKAVHVSYIHSPMRYLYDQYDVYFGKDAPAYQRLGMKLVQNYLMNWDLDSNKNVDVMIANSQFVQNRILNYYQRESNVVLPFVDLKDFRAQQKSPAAKEDYYLMVTAFAPNKRVDLAINAFKKLGKPLKIIGSGQQEARLRSMASSNIQFLGNLPREQVIESLAKAQALVFPGVEDFGITPIESLAAGTPVIAFKEGGVLETLDESVAQFFTEANSESLEQAVMDFEKHQFNKSDLLNRAEQFSKEKFKNQMFEVIEESMGKALSRLPSSQKPH